jgi:hypothetical protein
MLPAFDGAIPFYVDGRKGEAAHRASSAGVGNAGGENPALSPSAGRRSRKRVFAYLKRFKGVGTLIEAVVMV